MENINRFLQEPCFDFKTITEIKEYAEEIKKFEKIVIVGTGASIINARALLSILSQHSIIFLDNIDPASLEARLYNLEPDKTAFLIISKSGNTSEIVALTEHLLTLYKNFFVISENDYLAQLCKATRAIIHPKISGRFSILSIVGLLPAAIAGVDIERLVTYAKNFISEIDSSSVAEYTQWLLKNLETKNTYVIWHYSDQLAGLYEWVRQMYAESLGKNSFGFNTVISRGTIDQHSQLQLYLDGPDDKFYEIHYLDNNSPLKNLNNLFHKHSVSLKSALQERARAVNYVMSKDPYQHITSIIIKTMLSIMIIAHNKNLNPFDQPAVDVIKRYINSSK